MSQLGQPTSSPGPPTRLALHCEDGVRLRAELFQPAEVRGPAAVVCHPHPLHGGTMHNHVVLTLCRALVERGSRVLRFNFRGTSGSTGNYGGGRAERSDVEAALDHMAGLAADDRNSDRPDTLLVGYSFGAEVALSVDRADVAGWVAVSPPMSILTPDDYRAASSDKPVLILTGSADELRPPDQLRPLIEGWATTELIELEGEGHMLATAGQSLARPTAEFADRIGE